jgi:hypothetical protein
MSTTIPKVPLADIEEAYQKANMGSINIPLVPDSKQSLFTLHYRQGNNPHPQSVMFFASGTIQQIVERVKIFCSNTNKRFVQVSPSIINLDQEEKKVLGQ